MEIEIDFEFEGTKYNTLATMLEDGYVVTCDREGILALDYPIWEMHTYNVDKRTECVLSGRAYKHAENKLNNIWLAAEEGLTR